MVEQILLEILRNVFESTLVKNSSLSLPTDHYLHINQCDKISCQNSSI